MKILEFTVPVSDNQSFITKEESLPHFYPHLHRHNEVQLTWIIRGEGTLIADNSMHVFQSNEIYWLGANQSHVFRSDPRSFSGKGKKKTHAVDIFFDAENALAAVFSIPELKQLRDFVSKQNGGFRVPASLVTAVGEKIRLVHTTTGVEQFLHFIGILKILSDCGPLDPLSARAPAVAYSDKEGIRLARVYHYIMQQFRETISLKEVAGLVFMTPEAFCRYFKKHTHHTLVSFINEVRVKEACKKLVENRFDSIAAVAYQNGFNSITHFNRVFRTVTGRTPKEYLESYQQLNESLVSD